VANVWLEQGDTDSQKNKGTNEDIYKTYHGVQQGVKSWLVGACHVTCQVTCQVMGVTSIDVTPAMATSASLDLAKAAKMSAFKQQLSYRDSFTVSQFKLELIPKCTNM
jgi:hypothetical protein